MNWAEMKQVLGQLAILMLLVGCAKDGFKSEEIHLEEDPDFVQKAIEADRQVPVRFPKEDFVFRGELSPSVYFHALIRDEKDNCKTGKWMSLQGKKNVELMRVCSTTYKICELEGSCQISRHKQVRSFNYEGQQNGRSIFFEIKSGGCVFGYGVQGACLDPFYTVAADLTHHKPGSVIYLPDAVGLSLPGGEKHLGFFVVRDRGGAIKGPHRFDFFSGTLHWRDAKNPFAELQLADTKNRLAYFRVQGETALKFLKSRSYPQLPKTKGPDLLLANEVDSEFSNSSSGFARLVR